MGNSYSMDHIAEAHINTDITCNIKEPQQKYLERSVIDYCRGGGGFTGSNVNRKAMIRN